MPFQSDILTGLRSGAGAPPGLLARIGQGLDFPGRIIRNILLNRRLNAPSTGRDVLRRLGLAGRNRPGFDAGDVGGFLTEVALDPLNLLAGVGTLTRTGRLASRAGRLADELKSAAALRAVLRREAREAAGLPRIAAREGAAAIRGEEIARRTAQIEFILPKFKEISEQLRAAGAPARLLPTIGEQARAGQRALLSVGLPFTAGRPFVAGAPVLGALGRAGGRLGQTSAVQALRRAFDPTFGRVAALRPLQEITQEEIALGARRAQGVGERTAGQLQDILRETGEDPEKLFRRVTRFRESKGLLPENFGPAFRPRSAGVVPPRRRMLEAAVRGRAIPDDIAVPVARQLNQEVATLLEREMRAGVPVQALRSVSKFYAERVLTPAARKFSDEFIEHVQKKFRKRPVFSVKGGFQMERIDQFVEAFSTTANDFFSKRLPKGEKWFVTDPSVSIQSRVFSGERTVHAARFFKGVAEQFARPFRRGDEELGELLKQSGLVYNPKKVKGLGIPKEIFDEALRVREKLSGPRELVGLFRTFERTTGIWKGLLTVPFPAFHVRNLFSDTILNWLGDAANPRQITNAIRLMRGEAVQIGGDVIRPGIIEDLGLARGALVSDIFQQAGIARAIEQPGREAGRRGLRKLKGMAGSLENFARTWHFLSKKAQGLSNLEAAASVKRHLFDFSELTDFERTFMRNFVLFYNWTRKIVPRLLNDFLENPRKMALLTRATTQPTIERPAEGLPEFVRQTAAVPIGEGRFLFGTGSPLEELQKFDPTSAEGGVFGGLRAIARRFGTQVNPLVRAPFEFTTGKDLFLDADIAELNKAPQALRGLARERELPGGATRLEADPRFLFLLRNQPLSRVVTTASQAADPRRGLGEKLLQLLGGVRTVQLDPLDRARLVEQQIRDQLLREKIAGRAGSLEIFFPTSDADPRVQALIQQLRQAAEARRAVQGGR